MLARVLAVVVCLSVCLSVTRRYCVDTTAWIELVCHVLALLASLDLCSTVFKGKPNAKIMVLPFGAFPQNLDLENLATAHRRSTSAIQPAIAVGMVLTAPGGRGRQTWQVR